MVVTPRDCARALVDRQARKLAEQRRRGATVRQVLEAEVAAAIRDGLAERAWLVGSLATGGFGLRSDVDLVVEALDPDDEATLWARLTERLGVAVDLMRFEMLSEAGRARVLREGILLVVT